MRFLPHAQLASPRPWAQTANPIPGGRRPGREYIAVYEANSAEPAGLRLKARVRAGALIYVSAKPVGTSHSPGRAGAKADSELVVMVFTEQCWAFRGNRSLSAHNESAGEAPVSANKVPCDLDESVHEKHAAFNTILIYIYIYMQNFDDKGDRGRCDFRG